MYKFFSPEDDFKNLIEQTLHSQDTVQSIHTIQTGWTNVTIDVHGEKDDYIFRFPRNLFFATAMVRDGTFCQFIEGKTSFKTPHMTLEFSEGRPFSMHHKIKGKALSALTLTQKQEEILAEDIAQFLTELHALPVVEFPKNIRMTLNEFLTGLAGVHQSYDFNRHKALQEMENTCDLSMVHGDFNPGNVLVSEDYHLSGVIDFAFATLSEPHTDIGRFWGRSSDFMGQAIASSYAQKRKKPCNHKAIQDTIELFKYVDIKYVDYMQKAHPEISLPDVLVQQAEALRLKKII